MWKYLYCSYDSVMKEFGIPFLANNDDHAMKIHDYSVSKAKQAGYESEFELYRLCKFNTVSGLIEGVGRFKVDAEPDKDPQKDLKFEE